MKLNNPFGQEVEMPPLSSLIDVLFLLLVFFMLTTTFDKGEGEIDNVDVQMPVADQTHKIYERSQTLEINLLKDGKFVVDNQPAINSEQLIRAIEEAYQEEGQLVVIVGDRNAPYQSVVRVFDVLQRLGIEEFTHLVRNQP